MVKQVVDRHPRGGDRGGELVQPLGLRLVLPRHALVDFGERLMRLFAAHCHVVLPYLEEMTTDVGEVWITSLLEDGHTIGLRIERSDPQVLVSAELLREWHQGYEIPFLTLKCSGDAGGCPVGDVFAIDGVNQRVVYEIAAPDERWLEADHVPNAYIARWPD